MNPSNDIKNQEKITLKPLTGLEESEIKGAMGVYTLIIFVSSPFTASIGHLGKKKIERGYYAYTGSAFGKGSSSLAGRVSRHLKKTKRKRWHIDYLLCSEDVTVKGVVAMTTWRRVECEINQYLMNRLKAEVPILNFGSSDCRMKCRSHLLYLGSNNDVVGRIVDLYMEKREGRIFAFLDC